MDGSESASEKEHGHRVGEDKAGEGDIVVMEAEEEQPTLALPYPRRGEAQTRHRLRPCLLSLFPQRAGVCVERAPVRPGEGETVKGEGSRVRATQDNPLSTRGS